MVLLTSPAAEWELRLNGKAIRLSASTTRVGRTKLHHEFGLPPYETICRERHLLLTPVTNGVVLRTNFPLGLHWQSHNSYMAESEEWNHIDGPSQGTQRADEPSADEPSALLNSGDVIRLRHQNPNRDGAVAPAVVVDITLVNAAEQLAPMVVDDASGDESSDGESLSQPVPVPGPVPASHATYDSEPPSQIFEALELCESDGEGSPMAAGVKRALEPELGEDSPVGPPSLRSPVRSPAAASLDGWRQHRVPSSSASAALLPEPASPAPPEPTLPFPVRFALLAALDGKDGRGAHMGRTFSEATADAGWDRAELQALGTAYDRDGWRGVRGLLEKRPASLPPLEVPDHDRRKHLLYRVAYNPVSGAVRHYPIGMVGDTIAHRSLGTAQVWRTPLKHPSPPHYQPPPSEPAVTSSRVRGCGEGQLLQHGRRARAAVPLRCRRLQGIDLTLER